VVTVDVLARVTLAVMVVALPRLAHADGPAIPYQDLPRIPELEEDLDDDADVSIVSAAEVDDDRVVGASKREQSLGSVASAVTVVTVDQIRRFGYRTLSEALTSVAGIYLTDDRAVERVGIRGVQLLGDANTRILVLIDGTPLNEPWSQAVDTGYALPVDLADVSRLEVIRGPVSSIYGTNAFLGIVNVVTREADVAAPAYGAVSGESFGGFGGVAGFAVGGIERQARGSVTFHQRGGEQLDYAALGPTDADAQQALAGAFTATWGRLFFQARGSQRDRQLPGAPFGAALGSTENANRDREVVGELGYNQPLGKTATVVGRLYASAYDQRQRLRYDDGLLEAAGHSRWFGGEVRGLFDLSRWMPGKRALDLTIGAAAESTIASSESAPADGGMATSFEQQFSTQGVYGEVAATPIRWATVTAGVRFDANSLFERKVNPRVALLLYDRDRVGAKLLFAQGFRNPSIFEAFFEDTRFKPACSPDCATMGTTLFPETITSYEAVVWARPIRGLKLRLSGWDWRLESMIERRAIFDPVTFSERFQYQNLAGLRSRGVEAEGTFRNSAGWYAFGNIAFADVRRNVIDEPPNSPEITAAAGVSSPAFRDLVHVSTEVTYVGARQTRDELVSADGWLGWNLALYAPSFRGFDVTIGARNLLGVRAQVVAQDDYDRQGDLVTGEPPTDVLVVPGAGRELFTRVGYRF